MYWLTFGLWVIAGLICLFSNQVTKFEYALVWILLLMHLFGMAMGW